MNSVHEPGPNGDSETALSGKLGRKLSWVHKTPNWPNWAHRRAQARACLAVSWALRPCRSRGPRPCRRMSCRVAGAPAPYCGRSAASANAVSWACARVGMAVSWSASRHTAQPQAPLPVAIHCIVLQCNSSQTRLLQYNILYCNTVYSLPT